MGRRLYQEHLLSAATPATFRVRLTSLGSVLTHFIFAHCRTILRPHKMTEVETLEPVAQLPNPIAHGIAPVQR
eukprot:1161976-Pelagomonas_calceolata.AAC.11